MAAEAGWLEVDRSAGHPQPSEGLRLTEPPGENGASSPLEFSARQT
jgi:hypothetical protein